jgi:hypothetical protein
MHSTRGDKATKEEEGWMNIHEKRKECVERQHRSIAPHVMVVMRAGVNMAQRLG